MDTCQINTIALPSDAKVTRILPSNYHDHISATDKKDGFDLMPTQRESERMLSEFDARTIFFDVFADWDERYLYGIGPRFFNLKKELLPMQLLVEGHPVKFRFYEKGNICLFKSHRLTQPIGESLDIALQFKAFSYSVKLEKQNKSNSSQDAAPLTISTLTKDNDPGQVVEWILWHRRLHSVERVVLYDNGSKNLNELSKRLSRLRTEVGVILVDWSFPYGIFPYNATQQGSLNHCKMRFATAAGYCINLDIDEYLVSPRQRDLKKYLDANLDRPFPNTCYIKECKVPNIRKCNTDEAERPKASDFKFRFQRFGHHPEREICRPYMKYIYKFDSPIILQTHETKIFRFATQNNLGLFNEFCYRLKIALWKLNHSLVKRLKSTAAASEWKVENPRVERIYANESDFYFYTIVAKCPGKNPLFFASELDFDRLHNCIGKIIHLILDCIARNINPDFFFQFRFFWLVFSVWKRDSIA